MSQEWLNFQSFFTDHELIGAINDLSIQLKLDAAGVRDVEMYKRATSARESLRKFLTRLNVIESAGEDESILGVDARFQSLTDAILMARKQVDQYTSVLMREGAAHVLPLLDDTRPNAREQLLVSLSELRRLVEQHQREDAAVIFEDR
jgi:hypothetical protein